MTQTNYTEWRCDRCGATEKKADAATYQPAAWRGLSRHNPPKSSEEFGTRLHLCGPCFREFERWLAHVARAAAIDSEAVSA